jgi:hypothetical protein
LVDARLEELDRDACDNSRDPNPDSYTGDVPQTDEAPTDPIYVNPP